MIATIEPDGENKLSPEQLAEIRDCWGMGVPLPILAGQHGLTENELRRQLHETPRRAPEPPTGKRGLIRPEHIRQMADRQRQLQALRQRFGGRRDD